MGWERTSVRSRGKVFFFNDLKLIDYWYYPIFLIKTAFANVDKQPVVWQTAQTFPDVKLSIMPKVCVNFHQLKNYHSEVSGWLSLAIYARYYYLLILAKLTLILIIPW